jgi:hypothetical protein
VNGDSKCTNDRGPSLVGSLVSSCADTRDFNPALAALVTQYKIFFFSPHTFSIYVSQQPRQGSRARPPVSECVSPIAKDVRAKLIKAAHRTRLLCSTAHFKVIFMYIRYWI